MPGLSNVGHTQAAAGVAGVVKVLLAMGEGVVPKSLHADRVTEEVDWSSGGVVVAGERCAWPEVDRPRRAGVSSFGISGTNAHVVLEQAPDQPDAQPPEVQPPDATDLLVPCPVSGRSAGALRAQAARLRDFLAERPELRPADVAWSLWRGRADLEHRAVVLADDRARLLRGLTAVAEDAPTSGVVGGVAHGEPDHVVFVFPGQGAQWPGMATRLLDSSPDFAARFAECAEALAPHVDWSPHDVLRGEPDAPPLDRVDVVQPLLWAVMVALAGLWRAYGVVPTAVVGHSQGEIAAACVAGALSLHDGALVVSRRAALLAALSGRGGMVSVASGREDVEARIRPWGDLLSIAADNGPNATVVSGNPDALDELLAGCVADGFRARRLPVDYASHSSHVEDVREPLLTALAGISPRPPAIPFHSTASTGAVGFDAGYWYDNLRLPVEFHRVARALADRRRVVFVEVGPHPVLTGCLAEIAEDAAVVSTLHRDDDDRSRFLSSVAEAHANGVPVDWTPALGRAGARRVDLPTYPFRRRAHWLSAEPSPTTAPTRRAPVDIVEPVGSDTVVLSARCGSESSGLLAGHVIGGVAVLSGPVLVRWLLDAGRRVGCDRVEELVMEAPVVLSEAAEVEVQVLIGRPGADGRRPVVVHYQTGGPAEWRRVAHGGVRPGGPPAGTVDEWPPTGAVALSADDLRAFPGLRAAWRRGTDVFAEVAADPADPTSDAFPLDAAARTALLDGADEPRQVFLWSGVTARPTTAATLRVVASRHSADVVSLLAVDGAGTPVLSVEGLVLRQVPEDFAPDRGSAPVDSAPGEEAPLARALAALPPARWPAAVEQALRAHVAAVLGHDDATDVDPERPFRNLGVDSTAAVQLRNRLSAATGMTLPVVLVFSHPTPRELARHVTDLLTRSATGGGATALDELDRLERALADPPSTGADRAEVVRRLRALLRTWQSDTGSEPDAAAFADADAEQMFDLIDRELGPVDVTGWGERS